MRNSSKPIIIWLLSGCFLIFLMVVLGGLTRLTHSGLSMVEWNMFMGSLPPSNLEEWNILFEKYKQYPEYQLVNFNIDLDEFKSIFYWEYSHRMLGRLLGLVFIVPFLWFWRKKKIDKALMPKLLLLLFLGGLQGFFGWYMVKSGLVKNPDVSHFRLALHLATAFITFAFTFWISLDLLHPNKLVSTSRIKSWLGIALAIILLQIIWGAFVAGLNAGSVYNTWPKMGDTWIAEGVTAMQPLYSNFIEGIAGVQFIHRYLAYVVYGLLLFVFISSRKVLLEAGQKKSINWLFLAVNIQFFLGVFTLIYAVPVSLGLFHQLGAFFLLAASVFAFHRFSRA